MLVVTLTTTFTGRMMGVLATLTATPITGKQTKITTTPLVSYILTVATLAPEVLPDIQQQLDLDTEQQQLGLLDVTTLTTAFTGSMTDALATLTATPITGK